MNSPSEWGLRSRHLAILLSAAALALPAAAGVYHSQQEALELAFPDATRVEKKTHVLDDEQTQAVEDLARSKFESRLVSLYTGWNEGELLGYAIIDIHTIRTQPEAFMVVVDPAGTVRSLRVLAFYEPEDYLPSKRWLDQFRARALEPDLSLRGTVHSIAGATLSSRAVTRSVRRALALWAVLIAPHPEQD